MHRVPFSGRGKLFLVPTALRGNSYPVCRSKNDMHFHAEAMGTRNAPILSKPPARWEPGIACKGARCAPYGKKAPARSLWEPNKYTHRRLKFGTRVSVKGRREYIPVGSMPAPCWQSLCRTPWRLLRHCRNLKCERYINRYNAGISESRWCRRNRNYST